MKNFSCFSNLELQQDYYNKQQVAIFIVLVVRYRRKGEGDAAASYAYSLPSHLTCDVHTFISGDRRHDDGLAMLCWEKLAQHTKEVNAKLGLSPRKVALTLTSLCPHPKFPLEGDQMV